MPYPVILSRDAIIFNTTASLKTLDYGTFEAGDFLLFFVRTSGATASKPTALNQYVANGGFYIWGKAMLATDPTAQSVSCTDRMSVVRYRISKDSINTLTFPHISFSAGSDSVTSPALTPSVSYTPDWLFISVVSTKMSYQTGVVAPSGWNTPTEFSAFIDAPVGSSTSTLYNRICAANREHDAGVLAAAWTLTPTNIPKAYTIAIRGLPHSSHGVCAFEEFTCSATATYVHYADRNELGPGAEVDYFEPLEINSSSDYGPRIPIYYQEFKYSGYDEFTADGWVFTEDNVTGEPNIAADGIRYARTPATLNTLHLAPKSYPDSMAVGFAGGICIQAAWTVHAWTNNIYDRYVRLGLESEQDGDEVLIVFAYVNGTSPNNYVSAEWPGQLGYELFTPTLGQRIYIRIIEAENGQWDFYFKSTGDWIHLGKSPIGAFPPSHINPDQGHTFKPVFKVRASAGITDLTLHYFTVSADHGRRTSIPWPSSIYVPAAQWPVPTCDVLDTNRAGWMPDLSTDPLVGGVSPRLVFYRVEPGLGLTLVRYGFVSEVNATVDPTHLTVWKKSDWESQAEPNINIDALRAIGGGSSIYVQLVSSPRELAIGNYCGLTVFINGIEIFIGAKGNTATEYIPAAVIDGVPYQFVANTLFATYTHFQLLLEGGVLTCRFSDGVTITNICVISNFLGSPLSYFLGRAEVYKDWSDVVDDGHDIQQVEVQTSSHAAGIDAAVHRVELLYPLSSSRHPVLYADPGFFLHRSEIVGGGANAVDGIDPTNIDNTGQALTEGSAVWVITDTNDMYLYRAYNAPGATESFPDTIIPDNNAGNWYWELVTVKAFIPAKQFILNGYTKRQYVPIDPTFYGHDVFVCYNSGSRITRLPFNLYPDGTARQDGTTTSNVVKFLSFPSTPMKARFKV